MAFKSEEELKEYLENLGTEYRFTCFKEKNAEGCHLLADYLESVKKDFVGAGKVFKSNCDDNNHPKSCFRYGNYCLLGKGQDVDNTLAFKHYKKACDLGYNDGCLYVGVMLTSSKSELPGSKNSVELDKPTGVKYLEKACDGGSERGCFLASTLYISGAEGIPQDLAKASKLSVSACDRGNIYACMNLSRMYRLGDGVEKSEEKANFFKEKAKEIRDDYKKKPSIGLQQYA